MNIEIDAQSGFCFGVVNAIQKAEEELQKSEVLYCLGDIVHNESEVLRLEAMGMITINHEQFEQLHDVKVLLRAHGEPPRTYEIAEKNNISIIDATCPVVLKLQTKIKNRYSDMPANTQIVIFGKDGHAEVNGLVGQTNNEAIVIENENDLTKINFSKNIRLFSQTTKSLNAFNKIVEKIKTSISTENSFEYNDTICRQVENRTPNIRKFASEKELVLFVSGKKSSNGKILFEECKRANSNSFFISEPEEIELAWLQGNIKSVGICGATSTPKWLMEKVAEKIKQLI